MKRRFSLWSIGATAFLLTVAACNQNNTANPRPEKVDGWAPIYASTAEAYVIKSTEPVNIENGGKIYVMGKYLFQVENNKGIHVLDISQPSTPKKVSFIAIKGAQEISIKSKYLYTNNINDLVVLDISDLNNAKEVKRMKSVFHNLNQQVPPGSGYFECVDPAKGAVVGWEKKTLNRPECVTN